MTDEELIAGLIKTAKAFATHPIYTEDGDPVILKAQADEADLAATRLALTAAALRAIAGGV